MSWETLRAVFTAALEIPRAERPAWLRGRIDLDEPLRREVASLLEAHEQAGNFLEPEDLLTQFLRNTGAPDRRKPR